MSILILSKDWRLIKDYKKHFPQEAVKGFSSLPELLKSQRKQEKGDEVCIILDEYYEKEQRSSLLKELSQTSSKVFVIFIKRKGEDELPLVKNIQSSDFNWNDMNNADMISHLNRVYCINQTKQEGPALIGKSKSIQEVRSQIENAARTSCSVHLLGETGTGKEIAARMLHQNLFGTDKPLVSANCSELTEALGGCKLFGVKKGAYTDAKEDEIGLVELANGSSFFLDEIEDLRLDVQSMLLRLLENGSYHRIGEATPRYSQFRLISASNIKLSHLVSSKIMREDLYYRIAGLTITLPSLREHREDIPELIAYFCSTVGETRCVEEEGMKLLQKLYWRGNVRQLFSVIKQCIARSYGKTHIHIYEDTLYDAEQPFLPFF
ncbi:MAG: sigma 54-interacting transcriptional regulator [Sphaerochaetaceae bacterium]